MPNIKGQPVNAKLEDIEDGLFKPNCFQCRHKNIKLVLILNKVTRTQNYISMCTNAKCFRHWDLNDTPSWVPAKT